LKGAAIEWPPSALIPRALRAISATSRLYLHVSLGPNAAVIARYYLRHPKAGPDEHDVARPRNFGMVRWVNLTESYWIRATTEQLLQATNALE